MANTIYSKILNYSIPDSQNEFIKTWADNVVIPSRRIDAPDGAIVALIPTKGINGVFEKTRFYQISDTEYDFVVTGYIGEGELKQNFISDLQEQGFEQDLFIKYDGQLRTLASFTTGRQIFVQTPFSKTSFSGGELVDKSTFEPTDSQQSSEEDQKKFTLSAVPYGYYKLQSYFVRRPATQDPFNRFTNDRAITSVSLRYVPSMYSIVESSMYESNGITLKQSAKTLNYSLSTGVYQNTVIFYDANAYNTFTKGCNELANSRLKSASDYLNRIKLLSNQDLGTPYTQQTYSYIENTTDAADLIPFYVKTEFSTERTGIFSNLFLSEEIKPFFDKLISTYADVTVNRGEFFTGKPVPSWLNLKQPLNITTPGENLETEETDETEEIFTTSIDPIELSKDPQFLTSEIKKNSDSEQVCSLLAKKISTLLFQKKAPEEILKLLSGGEFWQKENYSETICYRVTKTNSSSGKRQDWFIPNFPTLNVLQIFDSVFSFNENIETDKYSVFALKAVVGIDYVLDTPSNQLPISTLKKEGYVLNYQDMDEFVYLSRDKTTPDGPRLKFSAKVSQSIKLIEVPYFEKDDIVVYDSAPSRPGLSFYAYKQVDDKITAVFYDTYYKYVAKRQNIFPGDSEANRKSEKYSRQRNEFKQSELVYKGEPRDVQYYQLLVLETEPKRYEDFANGQLVEILNPRSENERKAALENNIPVGNSYPLQIQPNRDYWIAARIKDFNGNISDPTGIVKVRIVNDDGYINPQILPFNFKSPILPPEVSPSPSFSKTVYVMPSRQHLVPDFDNGQLILSKDDDTPFEKSFKIRIKSKNTNKKIDVNVFFDRQIQNLETIEQLNPALNYEVQLFNSDLPSDLEDVEEENE